MVRGNRELIAGLVRDPAVRSDGDARPRRRSSPRRLPTSSSVPHRSTSSTAEEMIDSLASQTPAGELPRRSRGVAVASRRSARRARAPGDRTARCRQRRRQPADRRRDGRPDRRRRARRDRRTAHLPEPIGDQAAPERRSVQGLVRAAWRRGDRAPRRIRASSGSCRSTTCSRPATPVSVFATNLSGEEVLGVQTVTDVDATSRRSRRPGLRVHTGGGQPRDPPRLRPQGHPGRVPHVTPDTARQARRAQTAQRRTGRPRRRAGHVDRRAQRAGRGVDPCPPVRPDRRAVPAGRADRRRQPVGQLRVELPQPRAGRPVSASAAPCRPATPQP